MIMPKEMKDKWVAALRSGKYNQTGGILKDRLSNGYCCLGVLEDVCDGKVETNEGEFISMPSNPWFDTHNITDFFTTSQQLAAMNDGDSETEPKSFLEIADWIEENVSVSD